MKSPYCVRSLPVFVGAACLLLGGCSESLEFGQVTGTVTLNGKPLNDVLVMFLPEPREDGTGAHSESVTDSSGKFELIYSADAETPGAVVGPHRVVIEDILAENTRDRRLPIRIHPSYSSAAHTPLKYEVKPGEQSFELEVKGRR